MNVLSIVENALYYSGKADPEFSPVEPSGEDVNAALTLLQKVADSYRHDIPFKEVKTLATEADLENIGAFDVTDLRYFIDNVAYPAQKVSIDEFQRISLITDIKSIPVWFYFDQFNDALKVYPLPESSSRGYDIVFIPKIDTTNLYAPVPAAYQPFFIQFLEYELALNICARYKLPWQCEQQRQLYYQQVRKYKEQNLKSKPAATWQRNNRLPWPWLATISGNPP